MTPAVTLEELLTWNKEASNFWKAHLDANPNLLKLPCGIGGAANVQEFVGHVWGVELRWAQRIAGLPVLKKEDAPAGPLDVLFGTAPEGRGYLPRGTGRHCPQLGRDDEAWICPGCRRMRQVFHGASLRPMRSSTASVIGRNWLRLCGPRDSRQDSRETCFSARL